MEEKKYIYITGGMYNKNPYHPGHGKKEFRLTQPYHTNDHRSFPYFELEEEEKSRKHFVGRMLFAQTKHHAHLYRIELFPGNRIATAVHRSHEAEENGVPFIEEAAICDKDYEGLALALGRIGIDF